MFQSRNHEFTALFNGMLCFDTDSGDILCNSHNLKSTCCNVNVP